MMKEAGVVALPVGESNEIVVEKKDAYKPHYATDVILGLKGRIDFAVGDLGYNLMYYWVSTYLMIFYTDVFGIGMAAVSTLMLVVRIFDAANDPIIGAMADRTKQRTGAYKPWIKWGSFGLGVSCILLFWAHPNLAYHWKLVYVYVTYILVVCFSTATNMPYGVLNGTLTTNTMERTRLSTLRMFMLMIGNMAVVACSEPILRFFAGKENNGTTSYLFTIGLFVLIAVPMLWRTAYKCKEVVKIPESQPTVSVANRIKAVKSKPILSMIFGMLTHGLIYYGRAAIYPYYFTYFCGNPTLIVGYGVVTGLSGVVGCLLAAPLHRLFRHKARANVYNLVLMGISTSLLFWFPPHINPVLFYTFTCISGICQGIHMVLLYSMIPDAIDFSYYETKANVTGYLYALTSFTCKVGGALAGAFVAIVLGYLGYIANIDQSESVLTGINFIMSIGTGIFCFVTALIFTMNNVSDDVYEDVKAELVRRQSEAGAI